ncbi:unnamed protein product, partial [Didymodactylos carnosus]
MNSGRLHLENFMVAVLYSDHHFLKVFYCLDAYRLLICIFIFEGNQEENFGDEDHTRLTTNDGYDFIDENARSNERFRSELYRSIINDKILKDIIKEHGQNILNTYSQDLVRTFCTIVENTDVDIDKCSDAIECISKWLLLLDENDHKDYDNCMHKDIWLLCHVYTSFEYDRNDLLSLYTARRILDRLNPNQDYHDIDLITDKTDINDRDRSKFRENIFRLMFDCLWTKLYQLCEVYDELSLMIWIETYTFITKYYPSDKVIHRSQLHTLNYSENDLPNGIKFFCLQFKIEFMHLSYLIIMNEKIPKPIELITGLLKENEIDGGPISCLSILPNIIDLINDYFQQQNCDADALMIDIQQWIISILKTIKTNDIQKQIDYLLKYLNEKCQLRLAMKQFLFDQLSNLIIELKQKTIKVFNKQKTDTFSIMKILLPYVVQCLPESTVKDFEYILPYHPSVIKMNTDDREKYTLIDLFFFHIRNRLDNEPIKYEFINSIKLSTPPTIRGKRLTAIVENLYKLMTDYLLIRST